jgi:hypothetical protein
MEGVTFTDLLLQNGIPGIMLAWFIWYLQKRDKTHEEERATWKASSDRHVDKFTEVVDKNTTALIKMEENLKKAQCNFDARVRTG